MRVEYGATRTVLLTKRWAIKLPGRWRWTDRANWWCAFLNGLLANCQERQWWQGAPYLRGHLCPVLWSFPGGWCVVMQRARPFTTSDMATLWSDELNLTVGDRLLTEEYFKTRDANECVMPGEIKESSLGWIDDRVVILDYGN